MSNARHFLKPGTLTPAELARDITTSVSAARTAQRTAAANGQHNLAALMGDAVDEHLDELADANNGTWKPKHT